MSVSREFVLDLTRSAARDLGMRTYWTSWLLLLALVQACRRDALSLPAADRHDARRGELAEELGELRDMVWRAGIDPDRAAETAAATWRADLSTPCHEDGPRLRPHTQATLVLGSMHERAAADPRATGGDGEPDPRAVHLFLGLLDHPDGAVGTFLRELGTDVVAAREAAAVPGDEWALGEVVDERYEVTAIITAGGMGVVYRVHHRDWGIDLAVKAPRGAHFADPSVLPLFEAEARAWLELGAHPHVVGCRYVARYRGLPRVMAEWMPGGSLADAIENRELYAPGGSAALARILDIAIQSAWGLDHVHRCGLVHQDVKPGNLLLAPEPDGRMLAKVTDIGLARAWTVGVPRQVDALRRAVDLAGTVAAGYAGYTPAYCSPEQYAWSTGHKQLLDRATDVWSWAATILAMFHGHRPSLLGTETPRLLTQLTGGGGQAPPPGPDVPALPRAVAEILAHCLLPYELRPHDMNAVAERLIAAHRLLFGTDYPRERPAPPERRSTEGMVNEALSWLELGDLDTARTLLTAAVGQDPSHPYAVFHRLRLEWHRAAITDTQMRAAVLDAQRSDPLDPVYELFLGAVALERCDGRAARTHLELLPWQLPHDPMAQRLRATAHRRQVHGAGFTARLGAPITQLAVADHQAFAAVIGRSVHVYGPTFRRRTVLTVPGDAPITVGWWVIRDLLAVGAGDTAYVHDLRSGALVREHRLPSAEVTGIGFLEEEAGEQLWVASATGIWRIGADGAVTDADGTFARPSHSALPSRSAATGRPEPQTTATSVGGATLLTVSPDARVTTHDTATGRLIAQGPWTFHEPGAPTAVGVSRDGALAVVGTATGAVLLAEVTTGRIVRTLVTGGAPVTHAALTDREQTVVVATQEGTVTAFHLSQRVEATLLLPPPGWRHRQRAVRAAIDLTRQLLDAGNLPAARDCLRAAHQVPTAQRHPALIRLRREVLGGRRGEFRALWPRPLGIGSGEDIHLDPDGTRVAVRAPRDFAGVTAAGWWRIDTITRRMTPADDRVPGVRPPARLPGGSLLGVDRDGHLTRLDGDARPVDEMAGADRVQVSADGHTALLTGQDGSQRVWYPDENRAGPALPPGPVRPAALAADGTFALVHRSGLKLFDLSSGELFGGTDYPVVGLTDVQLSADGRTAITVEPGAVTVWELLWD
ncbi:protein kinase [Nocardia sp. NPDC059177]|uniref:protein kinase domain-containing protein n=1 Tax=Nocardia sp. NPDC059177 TaxID=3346759 RepID=UPI0036914078